MKAQRDIAVEVAKEKASALPEIKVQVQQQKVRRLNEDKSFYVD